MERYTVLYSLKHERNPERRTFLQALFNKRAEPCLKGYIDYELPGLDGVDGTVAFSNSLPEKELNAKIKKYKKKYPDAYIISRDAELDVKWKPETKPEFIFCAGQEVSVMFVLDTRMITPQNSSNELMNYKAKEYSNKFPKGLGIIKK